MHPPHFGPVGMWYSDDRDRQANQLEEQRGIVVTLVVVSRRITQWSESRRVKQTTTSDPVQYVSPAGPVYHLRPRSKVVYSTP